MCTTSNIIINLQLPQKDRTGQDRTGQKIKLDFPGNLWLAAFAILAMFNILNLSTQTSKKHKVIYGPSLHIIVSTVLHFYRNITESLAKLKDDKESVRDDRNAYLYILFVLTFYAFSIIVLMVKYIKREREGNRYENYYAEFVERKW